MKPTFNIDTWFKQRHFAKCTMLIALCFTFCNNVATQTISKKIFHHITTIDGLPSNFVVNIFQDKKGFIWFATRDGLVKYDGIKIKVYQNDEYNTNSLSNNHIRNIIEDENNTLWLCTFGGGLCSFNELSEQFCSYKNFPKSIHSLSNNKIHGAVKNKDDKLYIATEGGGLNVFDATKKDWKVYHHQTKNSNSIPSDTLRCITADTNGIIWIGSTFKGLCSFNPSTKQFTSYQHNQSNKNSLGNDTIYSLLDIGNTLYVGTRLGLYAFDKTAKTFVAISNDTKLAQACNNDRIVCLTKDNFGKMWVGTNNGLKVLDLKNKTLTIYHHNASDENSLSDNRVISLCEDKAGVMWVGTWDGGVNYVASNDTRFGLITPNVTGNKNGNIVYGLAKAENNNVWIATLDGLYRTIEKTDSLQLFKQFNKNKSSLTNDRIWSILEDNKKRLWIGNYDNGLSILSSTKNQYSTKNINITTTLKTPVSCIYQDVFGSVWVSSFTTGLYLFNENKNNFTHYQFSAIDSNALSSNQINCMVSTSDSLLWIGTNGAGLNSFNYHTKKFTRYQHIAGDSNSISSNFIASLYADKNGILWIATETGGLNAMDIHHAGKFLHFNKNNGLFSNKVEALIADSKGALWLAGNSITKVILPTKSISLQSINANIQFKNYSFDDAIKLNNFTTNATTISTNGNIYFGGTNGVTTFNPENVTQNNFAPKPMITGFSVLGKEIILDTNISFKKHIVLQYYQDFCSFEFAVPNYLNTNANTYQYKLTGINEDWVNAENAHSASYTKLQPGHYIFMVKASNADGVYSNPTTITLTIVPAFWQTWWFKILITLFLLSIVSATIYARFKSIRKKKDHQNKMEIKIAQVQMKALQSQIDPHFIFNALQAIHELIYQKNNEEASKYLTTFAKLNRTVLEYSRKQTITLEDEIKILGYYLDLEKLNLEFGLEYTIIIGEKINPDKTFIAPMILQPFVENCLKHGLRSIKRKGIISITITAKKNELICTINDNGIGRNNTTTLHNSTSLGTKIIAERLEIINFVFNHKSYYKYTDDKDEKGEPIGTTVEIHLPLLKDI